MRIFHGIQPNSSDARGLIHRSKFGRAVGGAVGGFIKGGPVGAVGGAVTAFVGGGLATGQAGCPPGFNLTAEGGCAPRSARVGGRFRRFRQEFQQPRAIDVTPVPGVVGFLQRTIPGGETGLEVLPSDGGEVVPMGPAVGTGQAVVGRFGAGIAPFVRSSQIRDCPRGMVLAVDSLCYNRRDLRNSERFWPRGRRPLLTGGEMRAISTAASAAKKLQRKQKDLMKLGLLPKPTARRRAPSGVAGHRATLEHA